MKFFIKSLLLIVLVVTSFTTHAQRYICKGISRYQQLSSSGKYTHLGTVAIADTRWLLTDTMVQKNDHEGEASSTKVLKVAKTASGAKKYILDLWGLTDGWITVESGFVNYFEDNGATKITYRIIKKEP